MTLQLFSAIFAFCLVGTITPGPNNLMVMASGANYGYRRTVPHMLGIAVGFSVMVALVGLGLMQVFDLYPVVRQVLMVACGAYLLYLAWKIAHAAPPESSDAPEGKPLTFLQAAAFQWVNPKAWAMGMSAITLYAPERELSYVLLIAACFALVAIPSNSAWILMGQQLRRLLHRPALLRGFNWTMAGLLVASLVLVLYQ
ncbi:Threonine/homoserine/homoserine lactone efflux protein [Pseudooceanicola antarcticus]|uniref:LysE family translocator n=1 Tax=Pseudooceanicola antarcticus TaxID=1247613 RepID=A0A285HZC3_9RHOB|nr:LysE family translocator [Pseudooceanicola antarcticus]PJE30321.1 LysE family translocator [Pseudooceanicola antarcticus]SNY41075.1 Threonine/homoserine/homoserine lactone efflux protein [Pseudooceanicola antarcticus]